MNRAEDSSDRDASIADSLKFPGSGERTDVDSTKLAELDQLLSRQADRPGELSDIPASDLGIMGSQEEVAYQRVRPQKARRFKRALPTLLIGTLVIAILLGSWFAYSMWSWQSQAGEEVTELFARHPIVYEQIGEVERSSFNWVESASPDCPEPNAIAFSVRGSKGRGIIYFVSSSGLPTDATWAGFRSGEQFWPLENR